MSLIPNLLTLLRLILAPIVAYALWRALSLPDANPALDLATQGPSEGDWAILAAGLFTFAAITDLLDGWAARALDAGSKLGRILDPIADKALVGLPLIVLTIIAFQQSSPMPMLAVIGISTLVIVGRDLIITILRMTASDGEGARVTQLAKWKTTAELLAVGLPIFLAAAPAIAARLGEEFSAAPWMIWSWLFLLGFAALLSAVTAIQYLTGSAKPAEA